MDSLLVKYIKSDYLAGTMNGELYLNSMGFFGRNGNNKQNDWLEGLTFSIPVSDLKEYMSSDYLGANLTDLRGIYAGYKYVHVLSFSLIQIKGQKVFAMPYETSRMFGDKCLVIANPKAFIRGIVSKCSQLGYMAYAQKVNYYSLPLNHAPGKGQMLMQMLNDIKGPDGIERHLSNPLPIDLKNERYDLFSKTLEYADQFEFRIIVYSDSLSIDPLRINVGPLEKMAIPLTNSPEILKDLNLLANLHRLKFFDSEFRFGNCLLDQINSRARKRDNGDIHIYSIIG